MNTLSFFSQGWLFASNHIGSEDTLNTLLQKNYVKLNTTFQCQQWINGYLAKQRTLLLKSRIKGK